MNPCRHPPPPALRAAPGFRRSRWWLWALLVTAGAIALAAGGARPESRATASTRLLAPATGLPGLQVIQLFR